MVILAKSGEINVQNEQYNCFIQYVHQTIYNRPMDHISQNVAEDNLFLDILLLVHNMYNKQHERPMDQIPHPRNGSHNMWHYKDPSLFKGRICRA